MLSEADYCQRSASNSRPFVDDRMCWLASAGRHVLNCMACCTRLSTPPEGQFLDQQLNVYRFGQVVVKARFDCGVSVVY